MNETLRRGCAIASFSFVLLTTACAGGASKPIAVATPALVPVQIDETTEPDVEPARVVLVTQRIRGTVEPRRIVAPPRPVSPPVRQAPAYQQR